MHTITDKKLLMLRPQEIRSSPYASRIDIDETGLESLAQCIAYSGLIEPLPVRRNERGFYELICGERRLKAAKMARLRRIPCIVHSVDIATAATYSLSENIQSKGLHFFEEALAIQKLIRNFGVSHTEAAFRLGITQGYLNMKLKLLKLDERLREKIKRENLPEQTAVLLLKIPPEKREAALGEMILKKMNTNTASDLIDEILSPKQKQQNEAVQTEKNDSPVRKTAVSDIRIFSNSLIKLYESMQSAGYDVKFLRHETEKYIEYKIRILKHEEIKSASQLSFKLDAKC